MIGFRSTGGNPYYMENMRINDIEERIDMLERKQRGNEYEIAQIKENLGDMIREIVRDELKARKKK